MSEWHCSGRQSAWQEEHQRQALIELPLTGMDLRNIRGKQLVVDAGTAVLHAAGESYALASPTARPRRSTSIVLGRELLAEMAPDFMPGGVRSSTRTALLRQGLRQQSADSLARDELGLMLVDSVMADARTQAGRVGGVAALSPAWQRLADDLGQCMATAFDQPLSLEQLARQCGASAFHASRVYRRATGSSIHRQLNRLRLREALFRLPEMPGRLTELAIDLGFSSHSHFSSAFRTEFGCPPSAWALSAGTLPRSLPASCPWSRAAGRRR